MAWMAILLRELVAGEYLLVDRETIVKVSRPQAGLVSHRYTVIHSVPPFFSLLLRGFSWPYIASALHRCACTSSVDAADG